MFHLTLVFSKLEDLAKHVAAMGAGAAQTVGTVTQAVAAADTFFHNPATDALTRIVAGQPLIQPAGTVVLVGDALAAVQARLQQKFIASQTSAASTSTSVAAATAGDPFSSGASEVDPFAAPAAGADPFAEPAAAVADPFAEPAAAVAVVVTQPVLVAALQQMSGKSPELKASMMGLFNKAKATNPAIAGVASWVAAMTDDERTSLYAAVQKKLAA